MKRRNNLTVFELIERKKRIAKRVTASVLIFAVVAVTCFGSGFVGSVADAEEIKKEPQQYIEYVINEMESNPDRIFTILEIVPDESSAEFIYYVADPDVVAKLDCMTQAEITGKLYADGMTPNTYNKIQDLCVYNGNNELKSQSVNRGNFRVIKNGITRKFSIELEDTFLQNVVPEYYSLMKGRVDVKVVEANDVTLADVRSADMIYLHGDSGSLGNTKEVNKLLTLIDADNPDWRGTNYVVSENYIDSNGKIVKGTDWTANFTDYEFIPSGQDEAYENNLKTYDSSEAENPYKIDIDADNDSIRRVDRSIYTAGDASRKELAVYEKRSSDGGLATEETIAAEGGYYRSRDISWAVVEEIWKLNLSGKYFPLDDAYGRVPIITDNSGCVTGGYNNNTNVSKLICFLEKVSVESVKSDTNSNVSVNGYDVFIQCVRSDIEIYNPYGLRTGVFNLQYFENDTDEVLHQKASSSSETTINGKRVIKESGDWGISLCNDMMYSGLGKTFLAKVQGKYGIGSGWKIDGSNSVFPLMNIVSEGVPTWALYDNFIAYVHDEALVPVGRYTPLASWAYDQWRGYRGLADRIDKSQAYMYNLIRWILGAKTGTSFDPNPGTGSTVELDVLEIEPCNDFKYSNPDKVAELLSKITGQTYKSEGSGLYGISDSAAATKYRVNVDCYTVNAFNGLTTDIIAEYDMAYIGTNTGVIKSSYKTYGQVFHNTWSNKMAYFPEMTANGASINANDITEIKRRELADFVNTGKILLLSNGFAYVENAGVPDWNSSSVAKDTQMYELLGTDLAGLENVIYESDNPYYNDYNGTVKYNESAIYSLYDAACVPEIRITGITDAGGNSCIALSDAESYTAQDIIDSLKITTSTGFNISFETVNCQPGKSYRIVLYIDEDSDGIYGEDASECKVISDPVKAVRNNETGVTGISGTLSISTVPLPDKFISALASWKIGIYETASEGDANAVELKSKSASAAKIWVNNIKRDTVKGALPIKNTVTAGTDVQINVLQIKGNGSVELKDTLKDYIELAETAINYDITIDSVDAASFSADTIKGREYNMIIVGTGTYNTLSSAGQLLIKDWAENDKSVLFMNDTAERMVNLSGITFDTLGQKSGSQTTGKGSSTNYAAALNEGQVTQYPYNVDAKDVTVGDTPAETYQLLLDFVDKAQEDGTTVREPAGVVVWNALTKGNVDTSNYFDADYKDAINNYYMYSIGNIMYTAMTECSSDADKKLMVNAIVRAGSKFQWVESPAIVVNNGIMAVDGYYIYADLEEISMTMDPAVKEKLQRDTYVVNFTPSNYDNGDMDGYFYWYKDGTSDAEGNPLAPVVLVTYKEGEAGKLQSNVMKTVNLTDFAAALGADYGTLMSQIESGTVRLAIKATNSDGLSEEKMVTFKQRKIYNLK